MLKTNEATKEVTSETLHFEVAGTFGSKDFRFEPFVKSLNKETIFIKNPKRNIIVLEGNDIVYVLSVDDSTFLWYRTGNGIVTEVITTRNSKTKEIVSINIKL